MEARYDTLGVGYADLRVLDTSIAAQLHAAIGPANAVINVGAGAGSYEPSGKRVTPVEHSLTMIRQRDANAHPVVQSIALRDQRDRDN